MFCLFVAKHCLIVSRGGFMNNGNILANYYNPLLQRNNFLPAECPEKFNPAGSCWEIAPSVGGGYYWIFGKQNLFDIKIHGFYFHEDFCLDLELPVGISIQRYDSISGEEFKATPHKTKGLEKS